MRKELKFISLLLVVVIPACLAQDPSTTTPFYPDWNGDSRICTVHPLTTLSPTTTTPTTPVTLGKFPTQAEFRLERVVIRHRLDAGNSSELTLFHYFYDYDQNTLVVLENRNGSYDAEFYNYDQLSRRIYYFGNYACSADVIMTNQDIHGRSAIKTENDTWHIRPLNEFLLFSSNASGREVIPRYLREEIVRGIPVTTWESCYVDRSRRRTVRREWSFAQTNVDMPGGLVRDYAVPVRAIINASTVDEADVQTLEYDEVYNILSYRPSLSQMTMSIPQPRGVYCENVTQDQLVSLDDVNIRWPYRFNVRIEASTSQRTEWDRVHLFYHQGDDAASGRLRYDYLPPGGEDYKTVIHDYTDNLTYTIDRYVGTCEINRGVEIPDVDPLFDPIRFFIKNEAQFIVTPAEKVWEDRGPRHCRRNSIQCRVVTTTLKNFPPIISPDTGKPSGETWDTTYIEYAWAMRAPNAPPFRNLTKSYDYPVSLFLRMQRDEDGPQQPSQTVNIEYEFYEMTHDPNLNQFDTSICYRSNRYEYLHLVFTLQVNREDVLDTQNLNRYLLDQEIQYNLINRMQIRYSRVTDLETDHEQAGVELIVFFTILGRTPNPDSQSGAVDDEISAQQAHDIIKQIIDDGQFEFEMTLTDDSVVQFRGKPSSLTASSQYVSTHSRGASTADETYTIGSQVTAAVVGSVIGLFAGVVLTVLLRCIRNRRKPSQERSVRNPIPTMELPMTIADELASDA